MDKQNIELVKEMVEIARTDLEDDHNKMIEETSQFLIELDAEYQKDVDIAKSRFKEFDELDSIGIIYLYFLVKIYLILFLIYNLIFYKKYFS